MTSFLFGLFFEPCLMLLLLTSQFFTQFLGLGFWNFFGFTSLRIFSCQRKTIIIECQEITGVVTYLKPCFRVDLSNFILFRFLFSLLFCCQTFLFLLFFLNFGLFFPLFYERISISQLYHWVSSFINFIFQFHS